MSASSRWDDLWLRVGTGGALVVAGGAAVWLGGAAFSIVIALAIGVMVWELACMMEGNRSPRALQFGVLASACLLFSRQFDPIFATVVLAIPAAAGAVLLHRYRWMFAYCAFCILVAGYSLTGFRDQQGAVLTLWLVAVVAATDIAGYFGGRMIGGRKFWPSVSPAKTWAGVVSGWLAAALTGLAFVPQSSIGFQLVWVSVVLSVASQQGDLAESAVKRRVGVKDSSGILPGHGGLLDRFDGLVGAALLLALGEVFRYFISI